MSKSPRLGSSRAFTFFLISSFRELLIMIEKTGQKLIVGISGATGTIFGVRLLQMLQGSGIETHLVMSKWGSRTLLHETPYTVEEVQQMASCYYPSGDQGAAISSGSFLTKGMVVAPCSVRTL